jgi:hypothetical protein
MVTTIRHFNGEPVTHCGKDYRPTLGHSRCHGKVPRASASLLIEALTVGERKPHPISFVGGFMVSVEVRLNEALAEIASLKTTVQTLRIENARITRDGLLKEAHLPSNTINRLHEAFATSTDNAGLRQAINVEKRRLGQ